MKEQETKPQSSIQTYRIVGSPGSDTLGSGIIKHACYLSDLLGFSIIIDAKDKLGETGVHHSSNIIKLNSGTKLEQDARKYLVKHIVKNIVEHTVGNAMQYTHNIPFYTKDITIKEDDKWSTNFALKRIQLGLFWNRTEADIFCLFIHEQLHSWPKLKQQIADGSWVEYVKSHYTTDEINADDQMNQFTDDIPQCFAEHLVVIWNAFDLTKKHVDKNYIKQDVAYVIMQRFVRDNWDRIENDLRSQGLIWCQEGEQGDLQGDLQGGSNNFPLYEFITTININSIYKLDQDQQNILKNLCQQYKSTKDVVNDVNYFFTHNHDPNARIENDVVGTLSMKNKLPLIQNNKIYIYDIIGQDQTDIIKKTIVDFIDNTKQSITIDFTKCTQSDFSFLVSCFKNVLGSGDLFSFVNTVDNKRIYCQLNDGQLKYISQASRQNIIPNTKRQIIINLGLESSQSSELLSVVLHSRIGAVINMNVYNEKRRLSVSSQFKLSNGFSVRLTIANIIQGYDGKQYGVQSQVGVQTEKGVRSEKDDLRKDGVRQRMVQQERQIISYVRDPAESSVVKSPVKPAPTKPVATGPTVMKPVDPVQEKLDKMSDGRTEPELDNMILNQLNNQLTELDKYKQETDTLATGQGSDKTMKDQIQQQYNTIKKYIKDRILLLQTVEVAFKEVEDQFNAITKTCNSRITEINDKYNDKKVADYNDAHVADLTLYTEAYNKAVQHNTELNDTLRKTYILSPLSQKQELKQLITLASGITQLSINIAQFIKKYNSIKSEVAKIQETQTSVNDTKKNTQQYFTDARKLTQDVANYNNTTTIHNHDTLIDNMKNIIPAYYQINKLSKKIDDVQMIVYEKAEEDAADKIENMYDVITNKIYNCEFDKYDTTIKEINQDVLDAQTKIQNIKNGLHTNIQDEELKEWLDGSMIQSVNQEIYKLKMNYVVDKLKTFTTERDNIKSAMTATNIIKGTTNLLSQTETLITNTSELNNIINEITILYNSIDDKTALAQPDTYTDEINELLKSLEDLKKQIDIITDTNDKLDRLLSEYTRKNALIKYDQREELSQQLQEDFQSVVDGAAGVDATLLQDIINQYIIKAEEDKDSYAVSDELDQRMATAADEDTRRELQKKQDIVLIAKLEDDYKKIYDELDSIIKQINATNIPDCPAIFDKASNFITQSTDDLKDILSQLPKITEADTFRKDLADGKLAKQITTDIQQCETQYLNTYIAEYNKQYNSLKLQVQTHTLDTSSITTISGKIDQVNQLHKEITLLEQAANKVVGTFDASKVKQLLNDTLLLQTQATDILSKTQKVIHANDTLKELVQKFEDENKTCGYVVRQVLSKTFTADLESIIKDIPLIDGSVVQDLQAKYEKEVNDILGKYKDDDMLAQLEESDKILSDEVLDSVANKKTTDEIMKALTEAINQVVANEAKLTNEAIKQKYIQQAIQSLQGTIDQLCKDLLLMMQSGGLNITDEQLNNYKLYINYQSSVNKQQFKDSLGELAQDNKKLPTKFAGYDQYNMYDKVFTQVFTACGLGVEVLKVQQFLNKTFTEQLKQMADELKDLGDTTTHPPQSDLQQYSTSVMKLYDPKKIQETQQRRQTIADLIKILPKGGDIRKYAEKIKNQIVYGQENTEYDNFSNKYKDVNKVYTFLKTKPTNKKAKAIYIELQQFYENTLPQSQSKLTATSLVSKIEEAEELIAYFNNKEIREAYEQKLQQSNKTIQELKSKLYKKNTVNTTAFDDLFGKGGLDENGGINQIDDLETLVNDLINKYNMAIADQQTEVKQLISDITASRTLLGHSVSNSVELQDADPQFLAGLLQFEKDKDAFITEMQKLGITGTDIYNILSSTDIFSVDLTKYTSKNVVSDKQKLTEAAVKFKLIDDVKKIIKDIGSVEAPKDSVPELTTQLASLKDQQKEMLDKINTLTGTIGKIKADHLSIDNTPTIQKMYEQYDNIGKGPTSATSSAPKKFALAAAAVAVPLIGTTAETLKQYNNVCEEIIKKYNETVAIKQAEIDTIINQVDKSEIKSIRDQMNRLTSTAQKLQFTNTVKIYLNADIKSIVDDPRSFQTLLQNAGVDKYAEFNKKVASKRDISEKTTQLIQYMALIKFITADVEQLVRDIGISITAITGATKQITVIDNIKAGQLSLTIGDVDLKDPSVMKRYIDVIKLVLHINHFNGTRTQIEKELDSVIDSVKQCPLEDVAKQNFTQIYFWKLSDIYDRQIRATLTGIIYPRGDDQEVLVWYNNLNDATKDGFNQNVLKLLQDQLALYTSTHKQELGLIKSCQEALQNKMTQQQFKNYIKGELDKIDTNITYDGNPISFINNILNNINIIKQFSKVFENMIKSLDKYDEDQQPRYMLIFKQWQDKYYGDITIVSDVRRQVQVELGILQTNGVYNGFTQVLTDDNIISTYPNDRLKQVYLIYINGYYKLHSKHSTFKNVSEYNKPHGDIDVVNNNIEKYTKLVLQLQQSKVRDPQLIQQSFENMMRQGWAGRWGWEQYQHIEYYNAYFQLGRLSIPTNATSPSVPGARAADVVYTAYNNFILMRHMYYMQQHLQVAMSLKEYIQFYFDLRNNPLLKTNLPNKTEFKKLGLGYDTNNYQNQYKDIQDYIQGAQIFLGSEFNNILSKLTYVNKSNIPGDEARNNREIGEFTDIINENKLIKTKGKFLTNVLFIDNKDLSEKQKNQLVAKSVKFYEDDITVEGGSNQISLTDIIQKINTYSIRALNPYQEANLKQIVSQYSNDPKKIINEIDKFLKDEYGNDASITAAKAQAKQDDVKQPLIDGNTIKLYNMNGPDQNNSTRTIIKKFLSAENIVIDMTECTSSDLRFLISCFDDITGRGPLFGFNIRKQDSYAHERLYCCYNGDQLSYTTNRYKYNKVYPKSKIVRIVLSNDTSHSCKLLAVILKSSINANVNLRGIKVSITNTFFLLGNKIKMTLLVQDSVYDMEGNVYGEKEMRVNDDDGTVDAVNAMDVMGLLLNKGGLPQRQLDRQLPLPLRQQLRQQLRQTQPQPLRQQESQTFPVKDVRVVKSDGDVGREHIGGNDDGVDDGVDDVVNSGVNSGVDDGVNSGVDHKQRVNEDVIDQSVNPIVSTILVKGGDLPDGPAESIERSDSDSDVDEHPGDDVSDASDDTQQAATQSASHSSAQPSASSGYVCKCAFSRNKNVKGFTCLLDKEIQRLLDILGRSYNVNNLQKAYEELIVNYKCEKSDGVDQCVRDNLVKKYQDRLKQVFIDALPLQDQIDQFDQWLSSSNIDLLAKQLEHNYPSFKYLGIDTYEGFEHQENILNIDNILNTIKQNKDKKVFGCVLNVCHDGSSGQHWVSMCFVRKGQSGDIKVLYYDSQDEDGPKTDYINCNIRSGVDEQKRQMYSQGYQSQFESWWKKFVKMSQEQGIKIVNPSWPEHNSFITQKDGYSCGYNAVYFMYLTTTKSDKSIDAMALQISGSKLKTLDKFIQGFQKQCFDMTGVKGVE